MESPAYRQLALANERWQRRQLSRALAVMFGLGAIIWMVVEWVR